MVPPRLFTLTRRRALVAGALGLAIAAGWWLRGREPSVEDQRVERLVASEELILALTPRLKRLDHDLLNLAWPGATRAELFADEVRGLPLAAGPVVFDGRIEPWGITQARWPLGPAGQVANAELALGGGLLAQVEYWEHAHFYFIDAELDEGSAPRLHSRVGLGGLARARDGGWWSVKGRFDVEWRAEPRTERAGPGPTADDWRIAVWTTRQFEVLAAPARLFAATLERAVPAEATRRRAQSSLHEDYLVLLATDEHYVPPEPRHFQVHSQDRHPGLAVVDINADGWDDLYAMDQWGPNLLLVNQGDGTLIDQARDYGLDVSDHCASAIFADFDNDGDPDLMLGRTLRRSQYYRNEEGKFVERSAELVDEPLPALVSSIAAADVNRDGLVDLYFSTYAAEAVQRELDRWRDEHLVRGRLLGSRPPTLLAELLSAADAAELAGRAAAGHEYTARGGPPNRLLLNAGGGRFTTAAGSETWALWRNSYQATFGDYDADGDPDLYVANDFSPNHLLENQGDGSFVDATARSQTADIGFGMGATWGDYDQDGRQDLYVSNMYSKAGQRITRQLSGVVDPRFRQMAGGNSLFKNCGDCFEKVSGLESPALQVELAGWSWGSQFLDIDRDGFLDLLALSGYYTAPREIAGDVDL